MSDEKYYTTKELIEYFRVSRFAITRAINSGKLKVSKKDGTKNLFSETDIKNYIKESNKNS